jgi:hypothetical protein
MQKSQARKYRSVKQTGALGLMKLAPLIGVVTVIYPFAALSLLLLFFRKWLAFW